MVSKLYYKLAPLFVLRADIKWYESV